MNVHVDPDTLEPTDEPPEKGADLPLVQVERDGATVRVVAGGDWVSVNAGEIDKAMRGALDGADGPVLIDTRAVNRMDTTGAWFVERARQLAARNGRHFEHLTDSGERRRLVAALRTDEETVRAKPEVPSLSERASNLLTSTGRDLLLAMHVLGAAIRGPQSRANSGGRWRLTSVFHQVDQMALRAVPVVVLMTFLVGGIVAQQAAFQLKYYGEELLTASLVGLLVLREVGVLLTAILVAGRTGSAITAELGTMRMREETDALTVMGLNPIGVLIFPRLLALIITMPLLTIAANFAGIAGALVMCYLYVDVSPVLFLEALRGYIDHTTVGAGMIKAPFMALIIGLVATVEGLKVGGSAESLGRRVTASVVKAIFLVIVVDGLFAVFFAAIDY